VTRAPNQNSIYEGVQSKLNGECLLLGGLLFVSQSFVFPSHIIKHKY